MQSLYGHTTSKLMSALFAVTKSTNSVLNVKQINTPNHQQNARSRGESVIINSTFTVSLDGSKHEEPVRWITKNGNSRNSTNYRSQNYSVALSRCDGSNHTMRLVLFKV